MKKKLSTSKQASTRTLLGSNPTPTLPGSSQPSNPTLPESNQTPTHELPPGTYTGSASIPNIEFNESEIDAIVREAANSVALKMGVPVSSLSAEVMDAIRTASVNALNVRTKAIIQRDVDTVVKASLLRGTNPLGTLDDRVTAAMEGISHIAEDAKIDSVLADTARLLWKKCQALKDAGFTEEQAFDLVLAEVKGRAKRNT